MLLKWVTLKEDYIREVLTIVNLPIEIAHG